MYEGIKDMANMWESVDAISALVLSPVLLIIVTLLSCTNSDKTALR